MEPGRLVRLAKTLVFQHVDSRLFTAVFVACLAFTASPTSASVTIIDFGFGDGAISPPPGGSFGGSLEAPQSVYVEPDPTVDAYSDSVGATPGVTHVDQSGASTYTVPIYTPPGTAGFVPNLSLEYSSRGSHGPLGPGWAIGGLSSISRCRKGTEYGDGTGPFPGTQFSTDESGNAYCLDGARLLDRGAIGLCPAAPSGKSGREYGVELDPALRVCGYRVNGEPTYSYWLVYPKDGSLQRFGFAGNSRLRPNDGAGVLLTNQVLSWGIDRIADATGNSIDFTYNTDQTSGELLITDVGYTGKVDRSNPHVQTQTRAPYNHITFTYEAIPTSSQRIDWLAGSKLILSNRLKQINVTGTVNNGTNPDTPAKVRTYKLTYITGNTGSRYSRLYVLQECAPNGKGEVCYPATQFQWGGGGGGLPQGFPNTPTSSSYASTLAYAIDFKMADVDGDGRQDLVWLRDNKCSNGSVAANQRFEIMVSLSTETGLATAAASAIYLQRTSPTGCGSDLRSLHYENLWHVFDFTGDGRDDLMFSTSTDWVIAPASLALGSWRYTNSLLLATGIPSSIDDDGRLIDLNGDSLPDLIHIGTTGAATARLLIRTPPATPNTYQFSSTNLIVDVDEPPAPGIGYFLNGVTLNSALSRGNPNADIDGDGASDMLFRVQFINEGGNCAICTQLGFNAPLAQGTRLIPSAYDDIWQTQGIVEGAGQMFRTYWYVYRNAGIQPNGHLRFVLDQEADLGETGSTSGKISRDGNDIQLTDINGDGQADVLYQRVPSSALRTFYTRLNAGKAVPGATGSRFLPEQATGLQTTPEYARQVNVFDINGDGRKDLFYPVDLGTGGLRYPLKARLYSSAGFGAEVGVGNTTSDAQNPQTSLSFLIDTNGDSAPDLMRFKLSDNTLTVARNAIPFGGNDFLTKITNGLGAISQFDYAPITQSAVYERLFDGPRQRFGRESPISDVFSSIWVVRSASQSAPTVADPDEQSIISYRYKGARLQAGGRGFLGFKAVETEDLQNLLVTSTSYRQDFPYIGRPESTVVHKVEAPLADACSDPDAPGCFVSPSCLTAEACQTQSAAAPSVISGSGQILSDATNTWSSTPAFVATTVESVAPYLSDSLEYKYDLVTANTLSHAIQSQFTMDGWGNLTHSVVTSQRGNSGLLVTDDTQTTTNVYGCTVAPPTVSGCAGGNLNTERQRLGRLSIATVSTARPSQTTVVRRASFEYDSTTLLLVAEIQGPYDDEPVSNRLRLGLRTDRSLDADGNPILEVACSTTHFANRNACLNLSGFDQRQWETDPTKIQRYRRTRYDNRGRFALGSLVPFYDPGASDHTKEEFSELIGIDVAEGLVRVPTTLILFPKRNTFGDPLNHVNAAGYTTDIFYGALGKEHFKRGVFGEFSKTTYTWCVDAGNSGIPSGAPRANCPEGAVFRVTTDSTGTSGTFNGKSVAPTMWGYFDRMGREVLKTTRIYQELASSTSHWSSIATNYDLTGRTKTVSVPYFSKDPTAAQSTARAGVPQSGAPKTTTVDYDAIGRTDKTTNPEQASNGTSQTLFDYNALKIDVTNPRSNITSRTMNSRDESVSVTEPNGLTVSFARNASGNLKSVSRTPTDGNSANTLIKTDLVHDRLGRKTQIVDPDKGLWTYKHNALGELVEQIDAKNQVQKLYRDALGRLIKRTETRRASGGSQVAEPTSVWTWDTSPRPGDFNPNLAGIPVLGALHVESLSLGGYTRTLGYDDGGRVKNSQTALEAGLYTEHQSYDEVGRPLQHIDPSTDVNATAGSLTDYSNDGYPIRVREASGGSSGQIYSEVLALSPRGQVREERFHNAANLSTVRNYDDATGRLLGIVSGTSGAIQNWTYTYDKNTNLLSRLNLASGHNIKETLTYDVLDRLKTVSLTRADGIPTTQSTSVTYDQLGNLMTKSHQVGSGTPVANAWTYAGFPSGCSRVAGPHAVSQFDAATYCYDENGNQTLAKYSPSATRTITYTGYDMAESIVTTGTPSSTSVSFKYAPDRTMFKRVDGATTPPTGAGCAPASDRIFCDGFEPGSTGGGTSGSTTWYVSNVEVRVVGTTTTTKRYIGSNLVITTSRVNGGPPSTGQYAYLFRDALGSLDAITNQLAQIQQRLSFDPWGQRRYADPPGSSTLWGILPTSIAASFDTSVTRQGYTGHEQLDGVGLVHMRGRLYDPQLGRFVQADPFVESDTAQGLNRYTYVLNNPLSLTDPSGYITFRQVVGIAIAVVAAIYGQYYLSKGAYAWSFAITVAGGFASAYVATGSVRAGLWGAFAAGVFWGIGTAFSQVRGDAGTGVFGSGYTSGQYAAKVAAHGAAGGTLSELQGGKFGHGFVSAGVTEAFSPAIDTVDSSPGRVVASAVLGGTASKLAGGSFSNGAVTSVFQSLFNAGIHRTLQRKSVQVKLSVSSLNQAGGYADENAAALAQFGAYESDYAGTIGTKSEVLGLIVKQGNAFYFTNVQVVPIKFIARIFPIGFAPKDVAGYTHTHPSTEYFNGVDFSTPAESGKPSFVRTSQGMAFRWSSDGAKRYQTYADGLIGAGSQGALPEHITNPSRWGIEPICPGGTACLGSY